MPGIYAKRRICLIANNNPGAPAGTNVFTGSTALTNAIAAAVNGDIIYVVPSGISYGSNINISKGVSVFGGGLDPDNDAGVQTVINNISITASNVRLSGIWISRKIFLMAERMSGIPVTSQTEPIIL